MITIVIIIITSIIIRTIMVPYQVQTYKNKMHIDVQGVTTQHIAVRGVFWEHQMTLPSLWDRLWCQRSFEDTTWQETSSRYHYYTAPLSVGRGGGLHNGSPLGGRAQCKQCVIIVILVSDSNSKSSSNIHPRSLGNTTASTRTQKWQLTQSLSAPHEQ